MARRTRFGVGSNQYVQRNAGQPRSREEFQASADALPRVPSIGTGQDDNNTLELDVRDFQQRLNHVSSSSAGEVEQRRQKCNQSMVAMLSF